MKLIAEEVLKFIRSSLPVTIEIHQNFKGKSLGYQVVKSTDSLKALELFKRQPEHFDLVITDQTMPEMTGDRLVSKLAALRPGIPTIICTGFSGTINPEKARGIGINGFLMKPIAMGEMAQMVRSVLDEAKGALPLR